MIMSLFQNSVLKKYIKQQDKDVVNKAYKRFSKYFHNQTIQNNIRTSKEEQFQQKTMVNLIGVNFLTPV